MGGLQILTNLRKKLGMNSPPQALLLKLASSNLEYSLARAGRRYRGGFSPGLYNQLGLKILATGAQSFSPGWVFQPGLKLRD